MVINVVDKALFSVWQTSEGNRGVGNALLLDQSPIAFFASRQCPGAAIRLALDWAVGQAKAQLPLIGGFHSPLEKSVLEVFLTAGAPVVIAIARNLEKAWLPTPWQRAVRGGRAAVVSVDDASLRLTSECAARRNDWVARHAQRVVVACAAAEGSLARQVAAWRHEGIAIDFLAHNG